MQNIIVDPLGYRRNGQEGDDMSDVFEIEWVLEEYRGNEWQRIKDFPTEEEAKKEMKFYQEFIPDVKYRVKAYKVKIIFDRKRGGWL